LGEAMNTPYLHERVGLYSLLRTLYTYPLSEPVLKAVAGLAVAPDSPLAPGLREMQARLRGNGAVREALSALNVEMTRLLEGPGATPAPPYASYYLHGGRLVGPAAVAARQAYLRWQVVPAGETRLPDDHIALELGFLAHLARTAAEAQDEARARAALQASREFIRGHLEPWLSPFCTALAEASRDSFFRGLAHLTAAAVQADLEWLNAVLDGDTRRAHAERRNGS